MKGVWCNTGGAVGHLYHLWENPELTFGEIKEIISAGAEGKLERVSEKLDGMNCVFTWDNEANDLRVARSGGDIKRGGMDADTLAKKFFGRGNVEVAFNSAFQVLRDAIGSLPDKTRQTVFGHRANRWYSVEIVYAENPNVISYDSNNVVFHGWPVFDVANDGSVTKSDDDKGISLLTQHIEQMQKAVSVKNWRVRGPTLMRMKKLSDGSIAKNALTAIRAAQQRANVGDEGTIQDYMVSLVSEEVANRFEVPESIAEAITARVVNVHGAPKLTDIKKALTLRKMPEVYAQVNEFVKSGPTLLKKVLAPIEAAIQGFAVELLKGVHSTLVGNPDEEVVRIRKDLAAAVKSIENSNEQSALDNLQKQLARLGDVEDIVAMEGVVFLFKGNAYKFTGSFAALNQILGMFRYGKKASVQGEVVLRSALERLFERHTYT